MRAVRDGVPGEWSASRRLVVNRKLAMRPLKRALTPERPLFTMEAFRVKTDFTAFHPDIPKDIQPYIAIVGEGYIRRGLTIGEFTKGVKELREAFMLRGCHPDKPVNTWISLADIEWAFQHLPNMIGIQGGESMSWLYRGGDGQRYTHRLIKLCAEYGMLYHAADGTYDSNKWTDLMSREGDFVRKYGKYLVFSQKDNISRRQFVSQSSALGLWLGGVTMQHGAWEDGGWYWDQVGFGELGQMTGPRTGNVRKMPRIFWDLMFVMGIARGCGTYNMEGQTLMINGDAAHPPANAPRAGIWDDHGRTTEVFKRYVLPLIRATIKHHLIPTKEQVFQNIELAVYDDGVVAPNFKKWPQYPKYEPLYSATYGFKNMGIYRGQDFELFPNTGRYYFIPVLPQGPESLGHGIRSIPLSKLRTDEQVHRLFDAAYPKWYEGDAFAAVVGKTITILNSNENEDIAEHYHVPLKYGSFRAIKGEIQPHSYVLGKTGGAADDGSLWFQFNTEYPDRLAKFAIICNSKPAVSIVPKSAAKAVMWDAAHHTLNLTLSEAEGAVEVTLRQTKRQ